MRVDNGEAWLEIHDEGPGISAELRQRLRDWQAADPDQATITALDHLIERSEGGDADAVAEIVDAFSGRLAFGTAGLRAALG